MDKSANWATAVLVTTFFLGCSGSPEITDPSNEMDAAELNAIAAPPAARRDQAAPVAPVTVDPDAVAAASDALAAIVHRAASVALAEVDPNTVALNPDAFTAIAHGAAFAALAEVDPNTVALNPDAFTATAYEAASAALAEANLTHSWQGILCRAACSTAAGMGCGAVGVACGGVTTITIGGFAIPCVWAIIAACGAAGGGASVCSDYCPD
jgi:hypothetical protein